MKTTELFAMMEKAGQKGGSELRMRSEELQTKKRARTIKSLKKELKKKSKILIVLEIALPFNPATGEEDDQFDSTNKFRPPVSATSAALMIKDYANKVPKTKEVLMKRAGVTEWDTSDSDSFTETDRKIFLKYRVPRLFTINVVSVRIPAITKDMSRDYAISVKRDDITGELIGTPPIALQINKLFRDTLYEEVSDYREKVASGEFQHTDSQQQEYIRKIYEKNPVSDDHPANWIELIEIPLDKQFSVSADFDMDSVTPEEIKAHQVVSRYSKGIRLIVEEYGTGDLEKFDKYFDYYEVDMACPVNGDASTKKGKMDIGADTKFEKPTDKIADNDKFEQLNDSIREFLDSDIDIERNVMRSVYVSKYDENVDKQLVAALKTVFRLNDPFCTDSVIRSNSDIISMAFGDEGMSLIEELDAGVSGRSEGNLDEEAAKTDAKQYDLNAAEFQDDGDSIDLEDVTLD